MQHRPHGKRTHKGLNKNMSFLRVIFAAFGFVVWTAHISLGAAPPLMPEAKLRLLDGGAVSGGAWLAGVEITLSGKAKTYWRMPGDSGLPPLFDWTGSENVKYVSVEWPRPERIPDASGTILGYHGQVIFPLLIEPSDPSKPIRLALKLDFGICEEVCVPLTSQASRALAGGGDKAAIEEFRTRVPRKGFLGATPDPKLLSITRAADALLVKSGAPIDDLILEGPMGWYFGDAARSGGSDAEPVFAVRILEKPSKADLGGLALIVTLLGRESATETAVTLDPDGAIR
jgi:DsbC/DsbD-like thiol-disulfide interchange protein